MTMDPASTRCCDACGKSMQKANRIFAGRAYCTSCYRREFIKTSCASCGGAVRWLGSSAVAPTCARCDQARRHCVRCDRPVPRAGIRVGTGVACPSCAPQFREQRTCDCCGASSARMSRPEGSSQGICSSCQRRSDHATCVLCHRHRRIGERRSTGPVCIDCQFNPTSHACPTCSTIVPGRGRGRCLRCINIALAERIGALLAGQLGDHWIRNTWLSFVAALGLSHGHDRNLRRRLEGSLPLFQEVARLFPGGRGLDASTFVASVDSRIRRRHLLASRYVQSMLDLLPIAQVVEPLANSIGALEATEWDAVAPSFRPYLEQLSSRKLSVATQRTYARVAIDFIEATATHGRRIEANDLVIYLKAKPGHAASLSPFVAFCRATLGMAVAMPAKQSYLPSPVERTHHQVTRLREVLDSIDVARVHALPRKKVATVLSLALDLPAALLDRQADLVILAADGSIVVAADATIAKTDKLYPFARRWLQLQAIRTAFRHRRGVHAPEARMTADRTKAASMPSIAPDESRM